MSQELFNTKVITISVVVIHRAKIVEHKCIQTNKRFVAKKIWKRRHYCVCTYLHGLFNSILRYISA